jgi:ATP-binding cassette subfamily B protein
MGQRKLAGNEVQAELFEANMKSLKLQQTQEAGSIFINEIKNRKRKDDVGR